MLINQNPPKTTDNSAQLEFERLPVYLVVFGLAQCAYLIEPQIVSLTLCSSLFQLVLALDAVHAQNTLQFLFLAYVEANYDHRLLPDEAPGVSMYFS